MEENRKDALMDTSHTEYYDIILNECRDRNVRLIALTHGHVDHVQNAAALSRALRAPIAMHKADYGLTNKKAQSASQKGTQCTT